MSTTRGTKSAHSAYQLQLFSNLPLYTTQLVCETRFPFCERLQVSAPADVAPILQEYFRLKDREEFGYFCTTPRKGIFQELGYLC